MKKLCEKLKNKLFIQPIDDDERYYLSKLRTDCIVAPITCFLISIGFVIFEPFDSISQAVLCALTTNIVWFCLMLVYRWLFVKWILFSRKCKKEWNDIQKN